MSIAAGATLGGKYRLEESIGKGGMGEVFEATALSTGERVAVKVVNRALLDSTLVERLRREAEAASRVRSAFVPLLYDVDKTPDDELFLVMELLHGESLSARLRRRILLSWEEVRQIGDDVLSGLVDAHAAGVIHRDLKPGNIFVESVPGQRERTRILDFGVCKIDAHDGESLTSTGEAVGTIAYMAPEQIRGASRVDERADVYAFAMVIFEALCGRLAYDASGSIALIATKLEKTARRIRDLAQVAIPEGLDPLLARCMARSPSGRPPSASDLLAEWRALGPPVIAPLPGGGARASELPTETGLTASPTEARGRRGSRAGLLVAAGALVASCVVLVIAVVHRSDTPTAATADEAPIEGTASHEQPEAPTGSPVPDPATIASPLDLPAAPAPTSSDVALAPSRPAHPAVRWRSIKRSAQPSGARRPPAEPQIQTEPRY